MSPRTRAAALALACLLLVGCARHTATAPAESGSSSAATAPDSAQSTVTATAGESTTADAQELATLQAENPDVFALLTVADTEIHYPVVQHPTDDTFYLNHAADRSASPPGAIFAEMWNAKDFSDFNTILYGHDMNDFTMFGSLEYYRDPTYFDAHRAITVTTGTETRHYTVFAAIVYDDRYLPYSFDFTAEDGRQDYLDILFNGRNINNIVRDDLDVTTADQLLTLSTCVSQRPNDRYLVVAKYVGQDG